MWGDSDVQTANEMLEATVGNGWCTDATGQNGDCGVGDDTPFTDERTSQGN